MKNSTRKVVILDNITSPYIQQAIIVLNEYTTVTETKVIGDAERIVNDYLKRNGYKSFENTKIYNNKRNNKNKGMGIVALGLILTGIIFYLFLKS